MEKCLPITSITNGLDSVFTEVQHESELGLHNPNCIRIFRLDIANSKFSHASLNGYLQKNIGRYVFSRATINRFHQDGDSEAIGLKAIKLLRNADNPRDKGAGGELGEILLYIFLEQKMNAPKLLSKVELKTGNQYIFGSDGVHLLQGSLPTGNPFFQLVLGESKMIGDLMKAVDKAFDSIIKTSKNPDNEIRLIEANIFAESFDGTTTDFLRSLIVPTKRNMDINVDNAFGVFLGYDVGIDASQYSNHEYRTKVDEKMVEDIVVLVPYIRKKIMDNGLTGHSFYFYIIPFDDVDSDRAAIINELKGDG